MVHIPFTNFKFAEPPLGAWLAEGVQALVHPVREVQQVIQALTPTSAAKSREEYEERQRTLPPEALSVKERLEKGTIKDSEQLEDEMDEAASRLYRRLMAEGMVGTKDDDPESFSRRKLQPRSTPHEDLLAAYLEQRQAELPTLPPPSPEALQQRQEAERERDKYLERRAAVSRQRLASPVTSGITEASKGVLLGMAAFKVAGLIAQLVIKQFRSSKHRKGRRPPPRPVADQHAPSQSSGASSARPGRAGSAAAATSGSSKQAGSGTKRTSTATRRPR